MHAYSLLLLSLLTVARGASCTSNDDCTSTQVCLQPNPHRYSVRYCSEWLTPSSSANPSGNAKNCFAKISYMQGKVNQHTESPSQYDDDYRQGYQMVFWRTDPDGRSGAEIDKMAYCKKWYPGSTNYRKNNTRGPSIAKKFCSRGNKDCKLTQSGDVYDCLVGKEELTLQLCDGSAYEEEDTEQGFLFLFNSFIAYTPLLVICCVVAVVANIRKRRMQREQAERNNNTNNNGAVQVPMQMQPMAQQPIVIGGNGRNVGNGQQQQPMVPTLPIMAVVQPVPIVQPTMLQYQGYQQSRVVQPMVVQPMVVQPMQPAYAQSGIVQPMAVLQPIPVPSADPYAN